MDLVGHSRPSYDRIFSWASTVFGAVPAARVCAFLCKAERMQMSDTTITYLGRQVSVPKEVADFLEQDRKRAQAEERRDRRHLSKSRFETALSRQAPVPRATENTVCRNLQLENLQKAIEGLDDKERQLIDLRYAEGMTQEEISKAFGVSRMAISKRLKKLHQKLRDSVT